MERFNTEKLRNQDVPNSDNLLFFLERQDEMYRTTFKDICEFVDETLWSYDAYIFDDNFEWVIVVTHEDICLKLELEEDDLIPPKPPKTGKVNLDFSKCRYYMQVFEVLREGLNLPDFLESWPGLFVCMRDYTKEDLKVEVFGLAKLPRSWDEDMEGMRRVFDKINKDLPNITFVYYN